MTQHQPVNWRALCEELVLEWDANGCDWKPQHQAHWNATIERARAALAQPEPEVVGPTDEELLNEWGKAVINLSGGSWSSTALAFARAVLARWGRPTPAPAGVVAELNYAINVIESVAGFTDADTAAGEAWAVVVARLKAAPVPVAVSERLPGPEDCDAEGRCWWLHVGEDGVGDWFQRSPYPSATSYAFFRMTHWLPAHALPCPISSTED